MTAYLLCTSPRSGSTLLCDLLWQTGVAGKPNSFFRPASFIEWCDFWHVPHVDADTFDATYLEAAIAQGSQDIGTFGLRMMWDSMPRMITRLRQLQGGATDVETLERVYGPCKFIHLSRDDKVAEAVSLVIAEQTGLWHRNADRTDRENVHTSDTANYNAEQIADELRRLEEETAGWNNWFKSNAITPHQVTYERLAASPLETLAGILAFLDLDPEIAQTVSPGTQKLGTLINQDWAARFRAEPRLPSARHAT